MKKNNAEFKEKTVSQLAKDILILREEISKLNLEEKVNPQKDTNLILKKRKRLAVMLTVLNQKREVEEFRPEVDRLLVEKK